MTAQQPGVEPIGDEDLDRIIAAATDVGIIRLLPEIWDALIARIRAAEAAVQWRPIETAPRDGTRVLGSDGCQVEVIFWAGQHAGWFNQSSEISMWRVHPPTHWMPLPLPPPPDDARAGVREGKSGACGKAAC